MFDSFLGATTLSAWGFLEPMPETARDWLRQPIVKYPLVFCGLVLIGLVLWSLPDFFSWRRARNRQTLRPADLDPLLHGIPPVIIDLRTPREFNGPKGHIPGAVNLPWAELGHRVHEVAKDKRLLVVLVDGSDKLSHHAAGMMAKDGYAWVRVLQGGMRAWRRSLLPLNIGSKQG